MNRVILQLWEESIIGNDPIPVGCTIHIDNSEKDKYINNIYNLRENKAVPNRYERIVGQSIEAFVEDSVYSKLSKEKTIKLSQVELNNLVKFEELITK